MHLKMTSYELKIVKGFAFSSRTLLSLQMASMGFILSSSKCMDPPSASRRRATTKVGIQFDDEEWKKCHRSFGRYFEPNEDRADRFVSERDYIPKLNELIFGFAKIQSAVSMMRNGANGQIVERKEEELNAEDIEIFF